MANEDNQNKTNKKDVNEIGKQLHDARVAKGYTIDDLQKRTKIQKRYLIAIEEGKFDALPGDFYVRAFVKQYADAVSLNGSELLKHYDNDLPDTNNPEYVNDVSEDKIASRSAQRKVDDRYQQIRRYIPVAAISLVVLVVIIVIWVAAAKNHQNSSQTNIHQSSSVSVSSNKKNKSESSSSSSSSKKTSKKAKSSDKPAKTTTSGTTVKKLGTENGNETYQVKSDKSSNKLSLDGAWFGVTEDNGQQQSVSASNGRQVVKLKSGTKTVDISMGNAIKTVVKVNGKTIPVTKSVSQKTVTLKIK